MVNINTRENYIALINSLQNNASSINERIELCQTYLKEEPGNLSFRFCLGGLYCQQGFTSENDKNKLSLFEKALGEFKHVASDSKDDPKTYSSEELVMLRTSAQQYIYQLASFGADQKPENDPKKEEYLKLALLYNRREQKDEPILTGPAADWLLYSYLKTERDLTGNLATKMLETGTFSSNAALALEEILEKTGLLRFNEATEGTIYVAKESSTKPFVELSPESFPLDTHSYQVNLFLAATLTSENKWDLALHAAELAYLQLSHYIPLASVECSPSENVEFVITPEVGKAEEKKLGAVLHTLTTKIGDKIVQKQQVYHPLQKVEKVALKITDEKVIFSLFDAGELPLHRISVIKKNVQHNYNIDDTLRLFVENKENFTQDYRHLNNLLVELYKHKGNDNIGDIKINLESLYKNILILQPDDSQSSLMLGRLSFQREEFESAEYYYKQFFQRYSTEFRKSNKQKQKKILEDIARHYGPSGDLVAMAFSGYKRNSGTLNNYFIQIDEKVENSHLLKLVLKKPA